MNNVMSVNTDGRSRMTMNVIIGLKKRVEIYLHSTERNSRIPFPSRIFSSDQEPKCL